MYQFPDKRPRFLQLTKIHFPLNAKLSAAHRISGLLLIISLTGYLALLNLITLHPLVTFESVADHCIVKCAHSLFWTGLIWHWLTGIRHLMAEHFLSPEHYGFINSDTISYVLLTAWILFSALALWEIWL